MLEARVNKLPRRIFQNISNGACGFIQIFFNAPLEKTTRQVAIALPLARLFQQPRRANAEQQQFGS
jgi:hypothetical protein